MGIVSLRKGKSTDSCDKRVSGGLKITLQRGWAGMFNSRFLPGIVKVRFTELSQSSLYLML